jgi:hypothetical protein
MLKTSPGAPGLQEIGLPGGMKADDAKRLKELEGESADASRWGRPVRTCLVT